MNIFLFILLLKYSIEEKIIFAWQMNRHGARGPSLVKDNKDLLGEIWFGKGELTSVGKRMPYLLGAKMRKRYKDFLSDEYDPQEIYIASTDENRTIETIQCYLQGLYPNKTGPKIPNNINDNRVFPPNKLYFDKFKDVVGEYKLNEYKYSLPYKMSI